MRVGTKSLLFGVHHWLWHPITVLIAWHELYGWPGARELVCIFIHDWGYWGKADMDGPEGKDHPALGARLALRLFGYEYCYLVGGHSRDYARLHSVPPSRLCWADKLSIRYDPWWLYLPRAIATGEVAEYRGYARRYLGRELSYREWYEWVRGRFIVLARAEAPCRGPQPQGGRGGEC